MRRAADLDGLDDLALRHVDHRNLAGKARGHPQGLAVGRQVHAVGAARHRNLTDDFQIDHIDDADGVVDPVAHQNVAFVAHATKIVSTPTGTDAGHGLALLPVDDLDEILAHDADHQIPAVGRHKDTGRLFADLVFPDHRLSRHLDRGNLIAVLQGGEHETAVIRKPDMTRRIGKRNSPDRLFRLAVPGVDVDTIEAQRRGHEPFVIGRKCKLVGVINAVDLADQLAGGGVEQVQIIADRIGHQKRAVVGGRIKMVRLFSDCKTIELLVGEGIDERYRCIGRVEHDCNRCGA